jgi:hypothetical protein
MTLEQLVLLLRQLYRPSLPCSCLICQYAVHSVIHSSGATAATTTIPNKNPCRQTRRWIDDDTILGTLDHGICSTITRVTDGNVYSYSSRSGLVRSCFVRGGLEDDERWVEMSGKLYKPRRQLLATMIPLASWIRTPTPSLHLTTLLIISNAKAIQIKAFVSKQIDSY